MPSDLPESAEFMINVLFDDNTNKSRKKILLYYYNNNSQTIYTADMYGTNVVRQWVKQPTRAEVDAKLPFYRKSINATTTTFTFTVPSNVYVFFFGRIGSSIDGLTAGVMYVHKGNGTVTINQSGNVEFTATCDTSTGLVTCTAPTNWTYLNLFCDFPLT